MSVNKEVILGIECGATASKAGIIFADHSTNILKLGPANYKLMSRGELENYFQDVRKAIGVNTAVKKVGVGMPGILTEEDKHVVKGVVNSVWPGLADVWIGNDLETALACLPWTGSIKFIIVSGTGSCCYGTNGTSTVKVGGYGHVLGDRGSGYDIGHSGLRAAAREFELNDNKSTLLDRLFKYLKVDNLNDLVNVTVPSVFSKADMAALTPIVLDAWKDGDSCATAVITSAMQNLVDDALCLTQKLAVDMAPSINIGLTGSILTENAHFQSEFILRLRLGLSTIFPRSQVDFAIIKDASGGALKMIGAGAKDLENLIQIQNLNQNSKAESEMAMRELILPILTSLSPTECRNPKSKNLDKMPIQSAIDLWLDEERAFYNEIAKEKPALERVIRRVTLAFQNGGRLFYVGSGTSGRLGILDASECPPTFKSPPHWVQGIISGGTKAIQESVEGAEDSTLGGMLAIKERRVNSKDVVFGIAASGRTPYVWGALHQAKELGAFTVFLGFNPFLTLKHKPDEVMLIHAGPEILTGSTRLKSGSATKCVLNMVTTLAMVQYGKCVENLMVDLNPSNEKLKERSLRIVLTIINPEGKKDHVSLEKAKEILLKNNYDIKRTVAELKN